MADHAVVYLCPPFHHIYSVVGRVEHMHKHKHIKTLFHAYAYAHVTVMSSGHMVGISISLSERLSANHRALYAYANMSPMDITAT